MMRYGSVWENVTGVFSSRGGEDFRAFLSGLVRWDVPIPERGWKNSGIINPAPVDGAYGEPPCFELSNLTSDMPYKPAPCEACRCNDPVEE